MTNNISDKFFQRGRDFLNVEYPVICGAMTWISNPALVAAVANAGGFGCLAGGNTPVDILKQQIIETRELTEKPFGVNVITIAPGYKAQLEMLRSEKLDYIVFAGGFPQKEEVEFAKETGAKVMCFASTVSIAKRLIRYGADAIILEGMEAGGHVGHVSLTVLLQQVLFQLKDVPIFVAGGIATGKMAAHLMLMGAAGIQLGTIFAMCEESCAHPNFKKRFKKAKARDAISTPQFDSRLPVVAVRALRNNGMNDFGKLQMELIKKLDSDTITRHDAQIQVEEFWMGALRMAVQDGDINNGSLMAGQSVGLVDDIMSVQDCMDMLVNDLEEELHNVKEMF